MRERVQQELRQIRRSLRIITALMETVHFDEKLNEITNLVCRELELDYEDVVSPSRQRHLVEARQMVYALARKDYSLADLGEFMGARDHSTVVHALHQHNALMDADSQYKDKFNIIKSKLQP